ncbi:MAG: hypothetical protein V3U54_04460 [Thermodesulfobacteriota bacterium]
MHLNWSQEYTLDSKGIKNAPHSAGVYKIYQDAEYSRYRGMTRLLKIGMSKSDLQQELGNHLQRHTVANRLKRILKEHKITFRYATTTPDDAPLNEKELLRSFEDEFWDIPVCNSTRGYSRGEDVHYAK